MIPDGAGPTRRPLRSRQPPRALVRAGGATARSGSPTPRLASPVSRLRWTAVGRTCRNGDGSPICRTLERSSPHPFPAHDGGRGRSSHGPWTYRRWMTGEVVNIHEAKTDLSGRQAGRRRRRSRDSARRPARGLPHSLRVADARTDVRNMSRVRTPRPRLPPDRRERSRGIRGLILPRPAVSMS